MTETGALTAIVADFEITGWDVQETEPEAAEGAALARTIVTKRFSGALEATSSAQLLTAVAAEGRSYVAVERIEGVLDGRRGSFVLVHGGIDDHGDTTSFGTILPGSGTVELRGLHGSGTFVHEGDVARLTLDYGGF